MNPVESYAGQNQQQSIPVPAPIAYKYIDWEEGPWVQLPYATLYPQALPQPVTLVAYVPPPIYRIELWRAMQTWPL